MRTSRSQGRTVFLLGHCLITCSNLTSYCNRILYIRGVDLCLMNVSLTAMCPGPRTTNTRGGDTFMENLGGDLESINILGRGKRPLNQHGISCGHPRFYFKHPLCLSRWIKLARGLLWHDHILMDIFLNVTF